MDKNETTIQQKKTVYLASLNTVKLSPSKDIYLITRSSKNKDYAIAKGWIYEPNLAPSWKLFSHVKRLKEAGEWNADSFATVYRPAFISEMKQQPAYASLEKLINSFREKDSITLVCYCTDSSICHRSILGAIFKGAFNCDVVNISSNK